MLIGNYPDRPISPPEDTEKPVHHCDYCGNGIYAGGEYYSVKGDYYCESCMEDFKQYAEEEFDED